MLELDYITVRGFKSIASIEKLRLGAMNVLIGPNGSGKSNFIGAFSFLNAIRSGGLQDYVIRAGGADKVLHFGSRETDEVYIDVSFLEGRRRYSITLRPSGADELVPGNETVFSANGDQVVLVRAAKEAGMSEVVEDASEVVQGVRRHLDRWKLYHFHDTSSNSPMKKTADVNDNRHLRPDGSNLAAFLYLLSREHQDSYNLITRTVRQAAPFFYGFQLEPQLLNPNKIPAGVASCGHRRLLRRVVAVGRDFTLHGPGDPVPPAGELPPVRNAGRRARAGYAPIRYHPPGLADEAGGGRHPGDRVHPVVAAAGPLSSRRTCWSRTESAAAPSSHG